MFWGTLVSMEILTGIEERFKKLRGVLDERSRRLLVAAESEAMGRRGISVVAKVTGVSRQVIRQGCDIAGEADSTCGGRQEEGRCTGPFFEGRP
jgi:hypothetical protein